MEELKVAGTPYDDVFRTLLNDCSSLIVPVINEVFGENYSGEEEIVFSKESHFLNKQDGKTDERITDTSFAIVGKESKKYHLECQSSADSSMLVRFFEYDTQIALDEGNISDHILTVTFPHSAVLFLRCNASTPDRMKIRMITPGGNVQYSVLVMKMQSYTIESIFEKNLLFLVPFYIFSHERLFGEYVRDISKMRLLIGEYTEIRNRLEELLNQRFISEYVKCTIIEMSNKVLENIAARYESVREGVKAVMGGRVLEYEAKTIRNEGLKEGIQKGIEKGVEEGIEKGIEKGIEGTVSILRDMGLMPQEIMDKIQDQYKLSPEAARKYV